MAENHTNVDKKLRMTEELIVTLLLGSGRHIRQKGGNSELEFTLLPDKVYILETYIKQNKIELDIRQVEDQPHTYILKPSLLLERILRDWTDDEKIIAVDSKYLTSSVFMLWVCLFAEKQENEAIVNKTNLALNAGNTVSYYFNKRMERVIIAYLNNKFHIGALDELFKYSLKTNRPSYETLELGKLLPSKLNGQLNELKQQAEGDFLNEYCK